MQQDLEVKENICNAIRMDGMGHSSDEYKNWKERTLNNQTGHKERGQRTGLWQAFKEDHVPEYKSKDINHFVMEIAPGYRCGGE